MTSRSAVHADGTVYLWFPPPHKVWSINERIHWAERSRRVRAWEHAAYMAARQDRISDLPGRWEVTLRLPFATLRRRDPHNYTGTVVKAVIDGLVRAKVWPDDTPEHVTVKDSEIYRPDTLLDQNVQVRLFPLVEVRR